VTVAGVTGAGVTPVAPKPRLRGVSHQVAALVFPCMVGALLVLADGRDARIATAVYGLAVSTMYTVSACYHRGDWSEAAKRRLRRLDHSTILLGIAGTYTPMFAVGVGGRTGRIVLVVVWGLAAVGVLVRNLWITAPRFVTSGVYLVVGWVALGVLPTLLDRLPGGVVGLVIAGGALYSAGAIVYARRRPDPMPTTFGYHEVFHAFVLAAGLAFYAAIAIVVT